VTGFSAHIIREECEGEKKGFFFIQNYQKHELKVKEIMMCIDKSFRINTAIPQNKIFLFMVNANFQMNIHFSYLYTAKKNIVGLS